MDERERRVLGHFLTADGRLHDDLGRAHPDHAALRRHLVENQFLTREDGVYWRSGGTVDV